MNIRQELLKLQDSKYKEYLIPIMNTVEPKRIIGVRTPSQREIAKAAFKEGKYQKFFNDLPHKYFEENNVHAFIIEQISDYDACIKELDKFLPYIESWSTCDSMKPKVLRKHKKELMTMVKKWIKSKDLYAVRYAIHCLMTYYLDDEYYDPSQLIMVKNVKSKEYYINMMRAWYFATALIDHRNDVMKLLKEKSLDPWTHNKTIQKAVESFRISDKDKKYLKTLKV